MERIAAIIFDFDGVLVDSEPLHEWAIREAVAPLGWVFSHEQFVEGIVGRGDERAFVTIAGWNGGELSGERAGALLARKRVLMAEGIAAGRYEVQRGAAEMVVFAGERFPLAVCSGSRASVVCGMLEATGLAPHFRHVVTADDVARAKPAPDGYMLAAERLGVEAARCLAIEDTPTGIEAAKGAGMRVIGVCHTCAAASLGAADWVMRDIVEVRDLLMRA
ncbi:MAG: HAD family phosphatase [Phycisphaeraceae bacterium]|nr:HAD family phosphatase [Phycisphaeraceae bacterium]